jgi:hypothetical protein
MLKFWHTLREPFEYLSISLERAIDLGDRVVGLVTFHGKGKRGGVEVSLNYGHIAVFEGQTVSRVDGYASWQEALDAAGLRE